MDTLTEGNIANKLKGNKLIPVIFSHGLSSNRSLLSGICRDFASHGHVVFSMDHKDGSSSYTTW